VAVTPKDAAPPAPAVSQGAPSPRPPAKEPTSPRSRCLEECRRRNMVRECMDENGLTACPCHCP
jgi:hypothetical protein